jgi:hypothetical protein
MLADNINPRTGDFKSLFIGMDPIESQVLDALRIQRNSGPSVIGFGNELHKLDKIVSGDEPQITAMVRSALEHLIRNRDINLLGVDVVQDPENQFSSITVRWVNLRALNNPVVSTPLSE